MSSPVIAVDLGGSKIAVALVVDGAIVVRREAPTRAEVGQEAVLEIIVDLVTPWRSEAHSICVAATGHVRAGTVSTVNPGTLVGWRGYPLAKLLTTRVGLPVVLLNDAHAAAWGEWRYGAGRGTRDFAFVTISTGVGAGIIAGGALQTGSTGLAGHVGFWSDTAPEAGEDSFLESYASGTAVARAAARHVGSVTTREVFELAERGDARAEAVIRRAVYRMARALLNLRWLLDPERVAIGGSVGLSPGYLPRLLAVLADIAADQPLTIVPAQLGRDAGLFGVADWAAAEPSGAVSADETSYAG